MSLNRWALGLLVVFCVVVIGAAYQETFLSIHKIWSENNHTYSHGYVLLAFVGYALFVERRWLIDNPTYYLLPIGLAIGALWLAANAVQVLLIQQMLLPVMALLLIATLVGIKASLYALLPIGSLYLGIPIADFFLDPLQDLTTFVVSFFIKLSGITAFIDGYDIHLPYGVLRIADGCAGLNYMLAGVCIGLFYSYLNIDKKRHMLFAIALMIVLALIGNWIRVYLLIMIGYHSEMQSSLVHEHGFFGWVAFAILTVGYFFYMERFVKRHCANTAKPSVPTYNPSKKAFVAFALMVLCLAVLPGFNAINKASDGQSTQINVALPQEYSLFESLEVDAAEQLGVKFSGADDVQVFANSAGTYKSTLVVSTYTSQQQGKELIYFANRVGRKLTQQQTIVVNGMSLNMAVKQSEKGVVVWYYKVGEKRVATNGQAKMAQLTQVFDAPLSSSIVLHIDCNTRCDWSEQDMSRIPSVAALSELDITN